MQEVPSFWEGEGSEIELLFFFTSYKCLILILMLFNIIFQ